MRGWPGNKVKLGIMDGKGVPLEMTPEMRSTHLYICGSTGTGKSKMLEYLIRQDIAQWHQSKCGLLLLDPHGPLYDSLINWIAWHETHKTADSYQFDDEAVCIPLISSTGHGHASLKRVHYISGKFALANLLAAAIVKNYSVLSARFLTRYLMFNKDRLIVPLMTGAANMSISLDRLASVPVELLPLVSQAGENITPLQKERVWRGHNATE